MNVTAEHSWYQPVCGEGDLVHAQTHRGRWCAGKVIRLETYYRKDRSAYHVYQVLFDGQRRTQWLGDERISHVVGRTGEE